MKCPSCKTELKEMLFYNTYVHYCPQCLGLWFEDKELWEAKSAKDENLSWLDIDLWKQETQFKITEANKLCPVCRMPLYEVNYGDSYIKVDVCNLCQGTWLDRGEFKKIISYLEKEKDFKLLHKYVRTLKEEFQEIFTGPKDFKEEVADFLAVLKILNYKFSVKHSFISKMILALPK